MCVMGGEVGSRWENGKGSFAVSMRNAGAQRAADVAQYADSGCIKFHIIFFLFTPYIYLYIYVYTWLKARRRDLCSE